MTGRADIVVRGAREHNLKNIDVIIPRDQLVVFTGVSGSGKSSLAFDTIFAEGQRRYVESLSAYARQFLGQMDKPDVDSIDGLSPAIAIDQKSTSHNPRSTVGTVTEVYDHMRLLFARIGHPHCPNCGRAIRRYSVEQIVDEVAVLPEGTRLLILGPRIRDQKGDAKGVIDEARRQGYVRARIDGQLLELADTISLPRTRPHTIEIVVDRLIIRSGSEQEEQRPRLADSLEQALKIGNGVVLVAIQGGEERRYSEQLSCPDCGIVIPELTPRSFSFNSPQGACVACGGLGVRLEMDPALVVPRLATSINAGAIAPWHYLGYKDSYYGSLLSAAAVHFGIDPDRPLEEADSQQVTWLLHGRNNERINVRFKGRSGHIRDYSVTFEGVLPMLEHLYRETPTESTRAGLEQYTASLPCLTCHGSRLKPEVLAVTVGGHSIADVSNLDVIAALRYFRSLLDGSTADPLSDRESAIAHQLVREIVSRLGFLEAVGLTYLTISRPASTLSGGEAQRIRLATQIGSTLTGVLYILDEPSIGLHQRDNQRLIETLIRLRDIGNTVLVVEHDEETIRAADFIVDIGPGPGDAGGHLVASGTRADIEACQESITGQFLSGKRSIPLPATRRTARAYLDITGAREHNLQSMDVRIPLGCLVAVTGVSGSGKSSLVEDILHRALAQQLMGAHRRAGTYDLIDGVEHLDKVIAIDQSPIGRTPRSNPATYSGAFGPIRELFAAAPEARLRGYSAGRFSFNVKGGRCEHCKGEGIIKIEMQFLPDVYVPCEVCHGNRYNREALEIRMKGKTISDVLNMTVLEALAFFTNVPPIHHRLSTLASIGLGYIQLGQPATTLSGGEAQRVKLAAELAKRSTGRTMYLLDEPTTGLHMADVEQLIGVLQRLVDTGNTVLVVEHNLDVIKCADWVIDLGPGGGSQGGTLVAAGPPEVIATVAASATGHYLSLMHHRGGETHG